jgi:hypothetical protein
MHDHLQRSRLEKILNVVMGKGRSRPARGWADGISLHLRFFQACGLASDRASFASLR